MDLLRPRKQIHWSRYLYWSESISQWNCAAFFFSRPKANQIIFNAASLSLQVKSVHMPHFHVSNSLFACINTGIVPNREIWQMSMKPPLRNRRCTSHWFEWAVDVAMVAAAEHQRPYALTRCHTKAFIYLLLYKEQNRVSCHPCSSSLIRGEKWHIIYSLLAVMEVLTKRVVELSDGVLSPQLSVLWIWILAMFGEPEANSLIPGLLRNSVGWLAF